MVQMKENLVLNVKKVNGIQKLVKQLVNDRIQDMQQDQTVHLH